MNRRRCQTLRTPPGHRNQRVSSAFNRQSAAGFYRASNLLCRALLLEDLL
jgi:hypothetical protein